MNKRTKNKINEVLMPFLHGLIRIADEENYDRDSFLKACADMFLMMTEISTFKQYEAGDNNAENNSDF